jgi:hypothetical protein
MCHECVMCPELVEGHGAALDKLSPHDYESALPTGESSAPRATAAAHRSSQLLTPFTLPSAYASNPAA